jgi:hypothetical protein
MALMLLASIETLKPMCMSSRALNESDFWHPGISVFLLMMNQNLKRKGSALN